jgi:hypothetical protein
VKMKEKKARSRLITEPELMVEEASCGAWGFVEKARLLLPLSSWLALSIPWLGFAVVAK